MSNFSSSFFEITSFRNKDQRNSLNEFRNYRKKV